MNETAPAPGTWEFFCEHANEVPNVCPCRDTCGCRWYHCKRGVVGESGRPRVVVSDEIVGSNPISPAILGLADASFHIGCAVRALEAVPMHRLKSNIVAALRVVDMRVTRWRNRL